MPHGVRIMVAYVFLPKEAAGPHLEALKEEASGLAENFGLKERDWWCETVADCACRWIAAGGEVTRTAKYRGDDIVFAFAKSEKGRPGAVAFVFKCVQLGIPHRGEWPVP
jgi:hypothetical protein